MTRPLARGDAVVDRDVTFFGVVLRINRIRGMALLVLQNGLICECPLGDAEAGAAAALQLEVQLAA